MKHKWNEKYMYYGIMLFVVAIFLVIMLPERKKVETELDIESKLPKIQQEEAQNEWISRNCTCRNKISGRRGTYCDCRR